MGRKYMSAFRNSRYFALGLFLLISWNSAAQLDINALLSSANNDQSLRIYRAQLDFLSEEKLNSPWIHRVEFRTRTNDFNLSQEDFRFRLAPVNPAEVKANKEYFKIQQQLTDTKYQLALNEALMDRYETIIKWKFLWEGRKILENDRLILEDMLDIYASQVNSLDFDYDDYVDAERDRVFLDMEFMQTDNQIENASFRFRNVFFYNGNIDPEIELISIEGIRNIMESNSVLGDSANLRLLEAEQELLLANSDLMVDKAENRRNIGYFQAEYDSERGNEFQEHMGFQIGIRIPITNPDRPDLQRSRLDLIDDEYDSDREVQLLKLERTEQEMKINHLLKSYDFLFQRRKSFEETVIDAQTLSDDPLRVLKNLETLSRLDKKLLDLKTQIYFTYIDLLDLYGMIASQPLRNYLSESLNLIDQQ